MYPPYRVRPLNEIFFKIQDSPRCFRLAWFIEWFRISRSFGPALRLRPKIFPERLSDRSYRLLENHLLFCIGNMDSPLRIRGSHSRGALALILSAVSLSARTQAENAWPILFRRKLRFVPWRTHLFTPEKARASCRQMRNHGVSHPDYQTR